jgi:hypothetical protein
MRRDAAFRRLSSPAVRNAAQILAYFHAIPLSYAVVMLDVLGLGKTAAYDALGVLVDAEIATTRTVRELGCARAPGLQTVIVLTARYGAEAPAHGLPAPRGSAAVTNASPLSILEQVSLTRVLLHRTTEGWTVGHDHPALAKIASARRELDHALWSPFRRPGDALPDAAWWHHPTLAPGQHLTMLVPPDACWAREGRAPVLLLGGSFTPTRTASERLWDAVAACAPVDVCAVPRGGQFRTLVSDVVTKHCSWPRVRIKGRVRWQPAARGASWADAWAETSNALHTAVQTEDEAARRRVRSRMIAFWDTINAVTPCVP